MVYVKLIAIFILSVFVSIYKSQDDPGEQIFDKIKAHQIKSLQEIEIFKNTTDMTYFIYYYKKSSKTSRQIAQILIPLGIKLDYIAELVLVNCEEDNIKNDKICEHKDLSQDSFPRMDILVPPEYRFNPYTKKLNQYTVFPWQGKEVSEKILFNFITKHVQSKAIKLSSSNIDNFINDKTTNKIILFTKLATTPLMYRGLSCLFYDRIAFGEIKDSEKDLIERFSITKFPSLIAYINIEDDFTLDQPRTDVYTGEINIKDAKSFITNYALREKKYLNSLTSNKKNIDSTTLFKSVLIDDYKQFLVKNKYRNIIFLIGNSTEIPKYLSDFAYLTNGFFLFASMNCQNELEVCKNTFKLKNYPSILHFNKGEDLTKRLKETIDLPLSLKGIIYEIFNEFKADLKEGTKSNFNQLLFSARENNKKPFIFVYQDDYVNPALYLMSSEKKYIDEYDFIVMNSPDRELMKQLSVTKFPTALILIQSKDNVEGAQLVQLRFEPTFLNLKSFADQFIPEKKEKKVEIPQANTKIEISFINSNEAFRENCSNKNKPCLLAFLDARENEKSKKILTESLSILEKVTNSPKGRSFTYSWLNSTCQFELTSKFNIQIDSIPNVVIYYPQKEIFSNLIGIFDVESISSFIELFILGKTPISRIKSTEIAFKNIKCEEILETKSIEDQDDEILREIVEEEKKKRAEFEKDRAKTRNTKRRRRKKKKKDL